MFINKVVITINVIDSPREAHWNSAKQLLRYLKQIQNVGLVLGGLSNEPLTGYSDASYNSDPTTCRSMGGFILQVFDSTVSWGCKWFKNIFPSAMETEYAAVFDCVSEAIWLRKQLQFILQIPMLDATVIRCDNEAAVKFVRSLDLKGRLKHMSFKLHYTREKHDSKEISVIHIYSPDNPSDMLTKVVKGEKLRNHMAKTGLRQIMMLQGMLV